MANTNQGLGTDKGKRAYGAARFALEFDGKGRVGVLASVDGGNFKAEPVGEQIGGDGLVTSYPGRQKFEDITLQVGTSMTREFWDWIKASIDNNYQRRSGAIVAYDFDGKERARRTFKEALISEISFPALDATASGPAYISVKIAPEYMEYASGGGGSVPPAELKQQKKFVPANFRLNLEKIDKDVTRVVTKIEGLTIKQNIIDNPIGNELWARKEVGRIEMPTLSLSLPETYVAPFMKWWKTFVGDGEHDHKNETTGSLEFLDSTCTETLMTLSFDGVGITGVSLDKHDAGGAAIRMAKVDLYIDSMSYQAGKA